MNKDELAGVLIGKSRKAFMASERNNVKKTWENIGKFILQSTGSNFLTDDNSNKGSRRNADVYDSFPTVCSRDLSSALHSTMTNPLMKWSKFKFKNEALNQNDDASRWLGACSEAIHGYLNDSNFDSQMGASYLSLVGLATMVLFHDEHYKKGVFDGFNFKSLHLGDVALMESATGVVDTLYRKMKISAKKAHELFPEFKRYEDLIVQNREDEDVCIVHCIYPREPDEVKLNPVGLASPEHRPYAEYYIDEEEKKILDENGYYELPFYAVRWACRPEEVYGFGPGHVAISDVLHLNTLRKNMAKGLAKEVDKPIVATQRNVIKGDFRPGGQTQVKDINGFRELQTSSRFEVAFNFVEDLKRSIKSAFYLDKLTLPPRDQTGEMTAYEIATRLEEMQKILGPVVSRFNSELLTPLIMRSFKILFRHNKLPPLPIALANMTEVDLDITYVNPLAVAQQTSELRNIQSWAMEIGQLVQLQAAAQNSDILDSINFDEIVQYSAHIRSIPDQIIRSMKAIAEIRKARQQMQQAQQMLTAGQQLGDIAKNMGGGGPPQ